MYCWRDWVFAFNLEGYSGSRTNLLEPELHHAALAKEKLVCIDTLWAKISQTIREQPRHGIRLLWRCDRGLVLPSKRQLWKFILIAVSGKKKKTGNRMLYRTMVLEGAPASSLAVDRSTWSLRNERSINLFNTFLIWRFLSWKSTVIEIRRCDLL